VFPILVKIGKHFVSEFLKEWNTIPEKLFSKFPKMQKKAQSLRTMPSEKNPLCYTRVQEHNNTKPSSSFRFKGKKQLGCFQIW